METTASSFVVALDIGTSRVRCLIAETKDGDVKIVGRGEEPSRGMRRGEVIDLPAATYAVNRAVSAAEEQADVVIQTLFLAVGSRHTSFFNNRACIGITREERVITAKDVQNVLASARRVTSREDIVPIGELACCYAVDDVRHVREPVGMHGTRLEADVHVITDARCAVENMTSCIDTDRHEVEEYVFAPYAAGEAVLDDDEKKLGVALIDIGAGTTRVILYRDNDPVFSSVIPVGGDHITSDIAVGLDLGLADAAKLKEKHAAAGPVGHVAHPIVFERLAKNGSFGVEPKRLHTIVDCRVREMLDIVCRELTRAGVRPGTIRAVLTGGTSRMPGLDALASAALGCPVRIGRPSLGSEAPMGPDMATAAGLLLIGARARKRLALQPTASAHATRFLGWIRQLF